jgi:hypothetical protein
MQPWHDKAGERRTHLTLVQGAGSRAVRVPAAAKRGGSEPVLPAVVGVLVDPAQTPDGSGFLPFDDVADVLATSVDPRALAGRRIGELRHRDSPGVVGGYVANGCIECDALLGRFQLEDLLNEHLQTGGTYAQLDIGVRVELPTGPIARRLTALG